MNELNNIGNELDRIKEKLENEDGASPEILSVISSIMADVFVSGASMWMDSMPKTIESKLMTLAAIMMAMDRLKDMADEIGKDTDEELEVK